MAVRIVEVGPRDGLQNEASIVPVGARIAMIDALSRTGLTTIEAGSFVSPRRVPQMADTGAVLAAIRRAPGVRYPVLVPNVRGMESAVAAGVDEVAVFLSATESFSQRNIACSIAESFGRTHAVVDIARTHGIRVRGYVSCVLGCPYEGDVALSAVVDVAERLADLGCYEISLGDTIGVGTPTTARTMVQAVVGSIPASRLALHFHDTQGRALANVRACLEEGVGVVDTAIGGLGGCPYAPGSSGNLATEELVVMLDDLGVPCGVDRHALWAAVETVVALGLEPRSQLYRARPEAMRA
jgi:hydroxymethylglutaryl-CoA lyase